MSFWYYGVSVGKEGPKVYSNWNQCAKNVLGYPGSKYKKFSTKDEAKNFSLNTQFNQTSTLKKRRTSKKTIIRQPKKVNLDNIFLIYTDGSHIKKIRNENNRFDERGGIGIYVKNTEEKYSKYWFRSETTKKLSNNTMEMRAALYALNLCLKRNIKKDILIRTDSQYLINGMRKYKESWLERDFQNVKNVDLWKKLYHKEEKLLYITNVYFKHIKAHSGFEGNEIADKLAGGEM